MQNYYNESEYSSINNLNNNGSSYNENQELNDSKLLDDIQVEFNTNTNTKLKVHNQLLDND